MAHRLCSLAIFALAWSIGATPATARPKLLVFEMEILDTSGEGEAPGHAARLSAATRALRDGLAASGRFDLVGPPAPPAGELPPRIRTCNGCEVDIARRIGADLALTSMVHKVSSLILSITMTVVDAASGRTALVASADIRGDNDRSWVRGTEWLVRHRLLPARYPGEG
ncbi:DUF3280 domain-containing protein [Arenibaculum pallidiluteum]|uniref:DUF3280 domain-containing protein n=1 Tax=Arenibaculum pallidiluteum TaxID=2812559 RepID=UPI001A964DDC|nr:DUF3280 domain-containing protein [Arenibaculum pallidiluteum]